jgi:hypothetical protein
MAIGLATQQGRQSPPVSFSRRIIPMKKLLVAAIALGGLCFAASANAGVLPVGNAPSHVSTTTDLIQQAQYRHGPRARHHRRPVCKTVIKRQRVGHHRWVQRRVRVCR